MGSTVVVIVQLLSLLYPSMAMKVEPVYICMERNSEQTGGGTLLGNKAVIGDWLVQEHKRSSSFPNHSITRTRLERVSATYQ